MSRSTLLLLLAFLPSAACAPPAPEEPEPLVVIAPGGAVGDAALARLPGMGDAARVLLSYYAALYNTGCAGGGCALGRALGIDDQCGPLHLGRIRRLMPDFDPSRCVYLPDAASAYTWIEALRLTEPEAGRFEVRLETRWKDGSRGGDDPPLTERWRLDGGRLVAEAADGTS